jgi:hypothetical protein
MNKSQLAGILVAAAVIGGATLLTAARLSPHETVSAVIDGNRVTIVYGRPYTKEHNSGEVRKIWGGLVPYGKVWRTGADEATLLITQKPIDFGGTAVPAGAYTLWTVPDENGGKLVISKQIGQWGTQYDESGDFARVDLKREPLGTPLDQFNIVISKGAGGGGVIKLQWEDAQYTAAFTVNK